MHTCTRMDRSILSWCLRGRFISAATRDGRIPLHACGGCLSSSFERPHGLPASRLLLFPHCSFVRAAPPWRVAPIPPAGAYRTCTVLVPYLRRIMTVLKNYRGANDSRRDVSHATSPVWSLLFLHVLRHPPLIVSCFPSSSFPIRTLPCVLRLLCLFHIQRTHLGFALRCVTSERNGR